MDNAARPLGSWLSLACWRVGLIQMTRRDWLFDASESLLYMTL